VILLAVASIAAEPQPPPIGGGWRQSGASLVLFDAQGAPLDEIGLGEFREELRGGLIQRSSLKGGASADGRFAWRWKKTQTVRPGRADRVLGSTVSLSYLGSNGEPLWSSDSADAPAGIEPVIQSGDGETALVVSKSSWGWSAACLSYAGTRVAEVAAAQRIERVALSRNGKFALALSGPIDAPLSYTFIDVSSGTRKSLRAVEAPFGIFAIENDGAVLSSSSTVLRLR